MFYGVEEELCGERILGCLYCRNQAFKQQKKNEMDKKKVEIVHTCGSTTEATTLIQHFIKTKQKKKKCCVEFTREKSEVSTRHQFFKKKQNETETKEKGKRGKRKRQTQKQKKVYIFKGD